MKKSLIESIQDNLTEDKRQELANKRKAKKIEKINESEDCIKNKEDLEESTKFNTKAKDEFESTEAYNSAIEDDINTISSTMNELKYKVNTDESISAIEDSRIALIDNIKNHKINECETKVEEAQRFNIADAEQKNLEEEEKQELTESSDATQDFLYQLRDLLEKFCRVSIRDNIILSQDGNIVTINGQQLNVEGQSNLAIIKQIVEFLLK